MANQLVPLTTNPNQTFQIALNINNGVTTLTLSIDYNEMANYWVMGVTDINGNVLLQSVPLITGTFPASNILQQYQYLNIGSAYVINASNADINDYPNATDLGTDFVLVWGDNV